MAKVIASTKNMGRNEWLQLRNGYIGGSDAGIILGVNKYKSAFELWTEKTGQAEAQEVDNEAIHFGNVLEDVVAAEFARRTGKRVRKINQMLQHEEHHFMMANLDRVVIGEKALLECKTASEYLKGEWEGDEIPASYLVQINHYLAVTGFEKAYIACLIGGNKFVWKVINRDEELINMIIQAEKEFWEFNVIGKNAPAIDGSKAAKDYINRRFAGVDKDKVVDLKAEHNDNIKRYLELKRIMDEFEKEKTRLENVLKMDLGDAELGLIGEYQVSWKGQTQNRVDSKLLIEKYPEVVAKVTKQISMRKFGIKGAKK